MAWDSTSVTSTTANNSSPNKKPKVGICIPHTGFFHTEFNEKMYFPLRINSDFCDKVYLTVKTYSITVARNAGVQAAIDNGCDYILWVDSDNLIDHVGQIEVEEEDAQTKEKKRVLKPFATTDPNLALKAFLDIMESDKNITMLSGLYRAKKKEGFGWAAWKKITEGNDKGKYAQVQQFLNGNFVEVDAIGMGFCLERVAPLKAIDPKVTPWFKWELINDLSEDFYHCNLLQEKGYKINLYTDVKLSHIGDLVITSDGQVRTREA